MKENTYLVFFEGKVIDGIDVETVKKNLGPLYKNNRKKIDSLFTGKKVVIKKDISLDTCRSVQKRFQKAGAVCRITKARAAAPAKAAAGKSVSGPEPGPVVKKTPVAPVQEKKANEMNCKACGKIIPITAKTCYHCGIPNQRGLRKNVFIPAAIGGILIIGIGAAIAIYAFLQYENRTHLAAVNTELQKVKDAQEEYHETYKRYTNSLAALDIFITTPGIKVQILRAGENCYLARGSYMDSKLTATIDCNSSNPTTAETESELQLLPETPADTRPNVAKPVAIDEEPLFSSTDGGFEIDFPEEPVYNTQSVNTPVGMIDIHFFMVEKKAFVLMVGYSDYPYEMVEQANSNMLLNGAADGATSNIQATITNRQDINLDDYTGKEISFTIPKSFKMPRGGNGKARFFLVDNRLYQILKIGTNVLGDKETDRYLDSFTLL